MVIFNKIAEYIVDYLLQQGIIEKEQEEIYIYGFYRVLIDGVNIISIFLISLTSNQDNHKKIYTKFYLKKLNAIEKSFEIKRTYMCVCVCVYRLKSFTN